MWTEQQENPINIRLQSHFTIFWDSSHLHPALDSANHNSYHPHRHPTFQSIVIALWYHQNKYLWTVTNDFGLAFRAQVCQLSWWPPKTPFFPIVQDYCRVHNVANRVLHERLITVLWLRYQMCQMLETAMQIVYFRPLDLQKDCSDIRP